MSRVKFNTLDAPKIPMRILMMGNFGTGKTYLLGYIAQRILEITQKKVKLFDFDLGWQTMQENKFDLDVVSYMLDGDEMAQAFLEFDEDFHENLDDPQSYGGFGVDSLTTLQGCAMGYVMKTNDINRRSVGKFKLTNENDYGVLVTMMQQILPQVLKISSHSVFMMTSHTRMMEDKNTGEMKILPAISGKSLPSQIGVWFNEVWYLKVEGFRDDVERLVQTKSGGQVDCKTQIAGVPYDAPMLALAEKALISYGINQSPTDETLKLITDAGLTVTQDTAVGD